MTTIIHWFRRDLRLHDNPALLEALRRGAGQVVPLFILDDAILRLPDTGPARVAFLLESLRALDRALRERGSRLILRRGPTVPLLREIATEVGAVAVHWNRDYTPYARRRDTLAAEALRAVGVRIELFDEVMILGPDEVRSGEGRPYTIYTPYRRNWRASIEARRDVFLAEHALPAFAPVPEPVVSAPIPTVATLGYTIDQSIPAGGEAAGLEQLRRFIEQRVGGITEYAVARDLPALPGTSRLSAYIRMGCVAPRACLRAALRLLEQIEPGRGPLHHQQERSVQSHDATRLAIETWISELAWRDFYYQIMAHFPYVLRSSFKRQYDAISWENDERLFAAWTAGRTGYPIVDAAMRQLEAEAWMHNRARMIVASFLTKDLLIDWRWGERHFMRRLVDGDHAANNGGWQWAAGTGTDAQPYFRIFNPVSQGQKHDAQGLYIRRYLPELAVVPDQYIHRPWLLPAGEQHRLGVRIGEDYPAPVVDHAARRVRALAAYQAVRS